jgi:hypothetical protein
MCDEKYPIILLYVVSCPAHGIAIELKTKVDVDKIWFS